MGRRIRWYPLITGTHSMVSGHSGIGKSGLRCFERGRTTPNQLKTHWVMSTRITTLLLLFFFAFQHAVAIGQVFVPAAEFEKTSDTKTVTANHAHCHDVVEIHSLPEGISEHSTEEASDSCHEGCSCCIGSCASALTVVFVDTISQYSLTHPASYLQGLLQEYSSTPYRPPILA